MRKLSWIMAAQLLAAVVQGQVSNPVPLFQFQVFYYQDDLEISPNAPMTITGPVEANRNIYLDPAGSLSFLLSVTATGQIFDTESPLDPNPPIAPGPITFAVPPVTNGLPYLLALDAYGTNGYAPLQIPQPGQTPNSPTGQNLLYNRADMIVMVSSNNTISVTSGAGVNNQATVISSSQWQAFMSTNGAFYDQRDNLTVNPVVIDVSNLVNWSATNLVLRPVLAALRGSEDANVQSIYLADLRSPSNEVVTTIYTVTTNYTTNSFFTTNPPPPPARGTYVPSSLSVILQTNDGVVSIADYVYRGINQILITNTIYITNWALVFQPGIVLSNGAVLPPQGLSVATPDPAYIVGNWNIKTSFSPSAPSDAGLSDTTYTLPSAIFADAITVLSPAWNPANSALSLNDRIAASDTVNAAFFAGNVPSDGEFYSGGLENFPRLLENWAGETFTWNGSMCCMFESRIANSPYPGAGFVYDPPARNWAFDSNFSNPSKLPPLTPFVEIPVPGIQTVAETNGIIYLSWSTWPGVNYTVQYTTNLSQPNWKSLGSFTALNIYSSFSDPATNTQQFYRLQIAP